MAIAFSENYEDFVDIIRFQNGEKTSVKKVIVIYNAFFSTSMAYWSAFKHRQKTKNTIYFLAKED